MSPALASTVSTSETLVIGRPPRKDRIFLPSKVQPSGDVPNISKVRYRPALSMEQYFGDYQGVQVQQNPFNGLTAIFSGTDEVAEIAVVPKGYTWKIRSIAFGCTASANAGNRQVTVGYVPPSWAQPQDLSPFSWRMPNSAVFIANASVAFRGYAGYPNVLDTASVDFAGTTAFNFWLPEDFYLEEGWEIWGVAGNRQSGDTMFSGNSYFPFLTYDSWRKIGY